MQSNNAQFRGVLHAVRHALCGVTLALATLWWSAWLPATAQAAPMVAEAAVEVAEVATEAAEPNDADPAANGLRPAPLYWEIRLRTDVGEAESPRQVRMYLPISSARQTILRRSGFHGTMGYREIPEGENLLGHWTSQEPAQSHAIFTDITVRIDGAGQESLPLSDVETASRSRYLASEAGIQPHDPPIRKQAAQLVSPHGTPQEHLRALYDFVHTAILRGGDGDRSPRARDVLSLRRGNAVGKARLLTALLRARGIPARMVGGLILRDLKKRQSYTYWVEAEVEGAWVEMDPTRGHFGRVPNRYLTLFYGDVPLIRHTGDIDFGYEFLVMQTTREAAVEAYVDNTDVQAPSGIRRTSNDKALTNPVAAIVWVTDQSLPPSLTEKFTAMASEEQVKVSFLAAPYESRLFRGDLLQDVIKTHDRLIREADVLVVQTRDDAGVYALLSQGNRRGVFKKKVIYLNGRMSRSVADFFGNAISSMLHPRGLFIFPETRDPNDFWDLVYDNFLNGVPIDDVADKWKMELMQFGEQSQVSLSAWRRFLMRTWVTAAENGVTPQTINLVLLLPLIAFLIVIYRGVIGFETFGTFTPAIICVAFFRTGLFWGVSLFLIILTVGACARQLLARFHIFLVARMALLISLVSIVMLSAAVVGIWWGVGPLVNVSVFPMVIMAGVIENFTRTHMEVGLRSAIRLALSTLAICILAYWVMNLFGLQSLIMVFPELLLLVMAATVGLGMWRGLRLTELWKYYRVGKPV